MTDALLQMRLRFAAASALAIIAWQGMAWANGAEQDVDTGFVLPWRLIAGFGLIATALIANLRRRHRADVAIVAGLAFGAVVIRPALFPFSYCHPNGQGPLWVEYALGQPSIYGSGYHEVFGIWVQNSETPGRALVNVQGALAALVPPSVYSVFRVLGTGRLIALAAAVGCVFEPVLARLSRCESYLRVALSLVAVSTSALVLTMSAWIAADRKPAVATSEGDGAPRARALRAFDDPRFTAVAGIVGAGLVIGQLARIHPGSWLPAAIAPLALLAHPGPWRRRVVATLVAGVGIALVVSLSSLGTIVDVLSGGLGDQWMPSVNRGSLVRRITGLFFWLALVGVFGTIGDRRLRQSRRAAASAWDVAALVALVLFAHRVGRAFEFYWGTPYAIQEGNRLLYAWVAIFAVAGVIGRMVPPHMAPRVAVSVGLAVLMAVDFTTEWEAARYQPTDVREALFVRSWTAELPQDAHVHYVERAGEYVALLPIHAPSTSARLHDLEPDLRRRRRVEFEVGHYWYRSSLCSTPPAGDFCDTVEARLELEPVYETTLPARPTTKGRDYTSDQVRVGLYRITAVHEPPTVPGGEGNGAGTGRPL
jgi:hypothetical protein